MVISLCRAIQRGATLQSVAVETPEESGGEALESQSLEERWSSALGALNSPPSDWELPPIPEGMPVPPIPPVQADMFDFLSAPLYGYNFKDFATRNFRPNKTDTIQQLITYTRVRSLL